MLNFIKQHSTKFIIGLLVIALLIISVKKNPLVKELENQNQLLKQEQAIAKINYKIITDSLNVTRERVKYLDSIAKYYESLDTFFVIDINNNKQKTNEEINNIPNLSVDSNIKLFYKLTEEYNRNRFSQDTI